MGGSAHRSYVMSFGADNCGSSARCRPLQTPTPVKLDRGSRFLSNDRPRKAARTGAASSVGRAGLDWARETAAVAHRAEVVALKYSPSGAHLVSCGNDGQVSFVA